jgi:hypothetical protein
VLRRPAHCSGVRLTAQAAGSGARSGSAQAWRASADASRALL